MLVELAGSVAYPLAVYREHRLSPSKHARYLCLRQEMIGVLSFMSIADQAKGEAAIALSQVIETARKCSLLCGSQLRAFRE